MFHDNAFRYLFFGIWSEDRNAALRDDSFALHLVQQAGQMSRSRCVQRLTSARSRFVATRNSCGSPIFAVIEGLARHSKLIGFLIEGQARGRPLLRRNRLAGGLRCSALGMLGETLLM
jgi:hypothetical protein